MYKSGRLCLGFWKLFLSLNSLCRYSQIICSQVRMTTCQGDLTIHPWIVKSLPYFTCIRSIHSSTYTHATEWYVGSLTDIVCLAVSCVLYFLYSTCENSLLVEQMSPLYFAGWNKAAATLIFVGVFPSGIIFNKPLLDPNCGRKKLFSCKM
jgi:hypothetical protein